MLISPRQLIDRMRHPRTRADELSALRARFRAQPTRREAEPERVASAERLRALRIEMARATEAAAPSSCATCAKGHPLPHGRWSGGHCCGGRTLDIWTATECASLKLAGTDVASLEPPRGDHAGCTFRGERGCSLAPEDRPSICLRYVCLDLRAEMKDSGAWPDVARIAKELETERKRFADG